MKRYFRYALVPGYEVYNKRLRVFIWRIRVVVSTVTLLFLWDSVLGKNHSIHGYTASLLLTYIFAGSFVNNVVIDTRAFSLGDTIVSGEFANLLLKPINYFFAIFMDDMGSKSINAFFSLIELTVLYVFLHPTLYIQHNIYIMCLVILSLFFAIVIYFFLGLLLSALGFWSSDVWGPRVLFSAIMVFAAGVLFPLDILPKYLYAFLMATPFPYLIYFPIKLYLGRMESNEIFLGFFIASMWILLLFLSNKYIWKKGVMLYGAQGR